MSDNTRTITTPPDTDPDTEDLRALAARILGKDE